MSAPCPDRPDAGFTLVETLVGLALLALVGVLLGAAITTGRQVLEGFEQRNLSATAADPFPLLTELLANARMPEPLAGQTQQPPSFIGEADRVAFVTLIEKRGQAAGLYDAILSVRQEPGGNATALVLSLSLRRPGPREVPRLEQQFALLSDLDSLALAYLAAAPGNSGWQASWHDPQLLPLAVRLSVVRRGQVPAQSPTIVRLELASPPVARP